MKTQPITHHSATTTATLVPDKPGPASACHVFKLGLDVDMPFAVTAIQCDHGTIKPAQKLTRPQLLKWVREQTAAGHTDHPRLHVRCGKGGKDRFVPLSPAMLRELRDWWKTHRHPTCLFPGPTTGWRVAVKV